MAQLWEVVSQRKRTNWFIILTHQFVDQKFYKQDIQGSIAHVCMLGKQGILTKQEMQDIVKTLDEICKDVESGKLKITDEYEDIHSLWRQI